MLKNPVTIITSILFSSLLGLSSGLSFAQDDELLPSEEAFAFSANTRANTIEAKWEIADGYYMYRDKLSFTLADQAGNPIAVKYDFPESKPKEDPVFGSVEVYLNQVAFTLHPKGNAEDAILTVKGQGCNEPVGVCYPPITHEIPITLAAAGTEAPKPLADPTPQMNATAADEGSLSSIEDLRNLLGVETAEDELLPVDEAFKVNVIARDDTISLRFDIAEGYYLYQNKFKFDSSSHKLEQPVLPEGELKQDEYFGEVVVYKYPFDASIKAAGGVADKNTLMLDIQYQGCAELGVCYPPQNKSFELTMPALISTASAQNGSNTNKSLSTQNPIQVPASSSLNPATKNDKTLWWILLTAFAAGIGLTFTPCVLPLIPILSSVIAGQGESLTKTKAAWLASIYVLGTAVTYAAIGAVAGATGDQLQAYFQNVWAIGIIALIFVLMALSMFGLYEIQMPSFIQSRMTEKSQGIKGGSTPMVFLLGLISALIVGACVSPVLISFLSIAIARGSASLGAMTMFSMALGMGVPLILIGMGAGHLIPKAGAWMDKVKYVFGVLLLAVAIYLLSVLPEVPVLYLWSALFIVVAVYLGATQSLPEEASGWRKLFKGLGTLFLVWGVLALVGAIYGQRDILHPLPERLFVGPATQHKTAVENEHVFTRVNNTEALDQQFVVARQSGKHIMIDYYADWCVDCIKMEEATFSDPAVRNALAQGFIALQVDVTDPNDEQRKALKKRFGVFGPPAVLFFSPEGEQLKDKSFYGFKNAERFLVHLNSI